MRAGRLDRRITIERLSESRNNEGITSESWSTFATLWASKNDNGGRTIMADQIEQANVETTWRIRDYPGIDATMRISYEGDIYDIRLIREIGRREGLILGTVLERP